MVRVWRYSTKPNKAFGTKFVFWIDSQNKKDTRKIRVSGGCRWVRGYYFVKGSWRRLLQDDDIGEYRK